MPGDKHQQLQDVAIGWLYGVGCSIFAKEVPTCNGIADALGIRKSKDVYYIEAKASRSDLMCKKQQLIYRHSIGDEEVIRCWIHTSRRFDGLVADGWENCSKCKELLDKKGDTGIDFYYLIIADGIQIAPHEYPTWGVLNEKGRIIRRAKRMKNDKEQIRQITEDIAHVLVYKVFGKLYLIN